MKSIITDDEIWKPIDWIDGIDGRYEISNQGQIRSLFAKRWCPFNNQFYIVKRIRYLSPTDNGNGYKIIGLKVNNKRKNYYLHRLVAIAFIPNPLNKPEVNHLNFDRTDNRASNLEWCTDLENTNYSTINMRKPKKSNSGIRIKNGKYEVSVYHGCNQYYVGRFWDYEDALYARNQKLKELGAIKNE